MKKFSQVLLQVATMIIFMFWAFQFQAQNVQTKNDHHVKIIDPTAHHEIPDDPYVPVSRKNRKTSPVYHERGANYFTTQVNTDDNGNNILGDAANEPSIAVDPVNPDKMVIGWRQFDDVNNNFRQAGYAYTTDGGDTWTFPGVIQPGVFRSDPVLSADADGNIYYNSLTVEGGSNFVCDVYIMGENTTDWDNGTDAHGGDKQWMTIDRTDGIGSGNIYAAWNQSYSSCDPGFFTRSTDGGDYYEDCVTISGTPFWGTLAVGPDGALYVSGTSYSGIMIAKSTSAQDPDGNISWDFHHTVDLGGDLGFQEGPNPAGLLGQAWVAVDKSGGEYNGYVYMLASVDPSTSDPLDVMFARSTDGGSTWDAPVKVNDDQSTEYWQWLGTMSVAPNGRIDVVWLDTRDHPAGQEYYSSLYYAYSIDGGETFSQNERLSESFDPHAGWPQQDKMGDYFHMYSDENYAHLAWANTLNGEQDVYYTRIDPNIQIADFEADNTHPYTTFDVVNFTDLSTGTPETWQWQFSPATVTFMNGTNAATQNPKVRFDAAGFYDVQLTITYDDGGTDTEMKEDYIEAVDMLPPEADFEANDTNPPIGVFINFNDLSINDPDTWLWSFSPSTITFMPGFDEHDQNTKVQFDEPGYYTVSLTASNQAGSDTETKVDYILAYLPEPVADFVADNTMPVTGQEVHFTDISFYNPTSWEWVFTPNTVTFAEGTDENTQNPIVQFADTGYYTVQLTVTNEAGSDTEIKTDYIHVINALTVVASATPQEICINDSVQLHAGVAGGSGDYSFSWSSNPEGFYSTEQDPVAYPLETTEYIVTVSDTDTTATDSLQVTVYPITEIELVDWPDYLCNQQEPPVQLIATPEGGTFSGNAVTDEGIFSPEEAPLGWNVITYTYINENNCESMAQDSIFVDNCVGIDEAEDITINIYPNPTRRYLNIVLEGVGYSDARLELVNIIGQVVFKRKIHCQKNSFRLTVDLSDNQNGLYILKLSVGNKSFYKKVFLSR